MVKQLWGYIFGFVVIFIVVKIILVGVATWAFWLVKGEALSPDANFTTDVIGLSCSCLALLWNVNKDIHKKRPAAPDVEPPEEEFDYQDKKTPLPFEAKPSPIPPPAPRPKNPE